MNQAEGCEDAGTWDELSVDLESEGEMLDYSGELVCWLIATANPEVVKKTSVKEDEDKAKGDSV